MTQVFSELVSRTAAPVVPLATFKDFVRQDHADDDTLLTTLLDAATLQAEGYVQMSLGQQTRELRITGTPAPEVKLDMGPVQSITAVSYTGTDNVEVTLPDTAYTLDGDALYPTTNWPSVSGQRPGLFRVVYVAGIVNPDTSPPTVLTNDVLTGIVLLGQLLYTRSERDNAILKEAAYRLLDTVRKGQAI